MDLVPQRLAAWWQTRGPLQRRQATALVLIGLVYVVHSLAHGIFFIEDSAITFAYARNLVAGDGPVPFPGGEPVEGFSNPSWTFLLAALLALGVPVWTGAKLLGALFGLLTLPLAFDLVRRARPGGREDVALVAPLLLALSPQFVMWNASGLENSLFCLLLAAGTWRLLRELGGEARGPWSALLLAGLAMTRPEGLAYATFAGVAVVLDGVATRRVRPLLAWVPTLVLPLLAWQAWRLGTFAWPFPNTYYAKQHQGDPFQPFGWTVKGWRYILRYLRQYGIVCALPVLGLGLFGRTRRRAGAWAGLLAVLAVLVSWDGPGGEGAGDLWVRIRVWALAGSAALAGLLTLGWPGWRARGLLWLHLCFGVFFALYSGGDWMDGFRWFSLTSVPLAVLLAVGLGAAVDALPLARLPRPDRVRGVAVLLPALALGGVHLWRSGELVVAPDTAVRDVHRRVRYMTWVQRRLDLDEVTLLDVDMGAHMFFSGWRLVDTAGLVDVPIARHKDYPPAFLRQYIFEETRPSFAHMHGFWAKQSGIPELPEWEAQYLEIPGFSYGGRGRHIGNHVRKDLFVHTVEDATAGAAAAFEGDVHLVHLAVPAPEVAAGDLLFVDTRWAAPGRRRGFRVLTVLDDGAGHRSLQAFGPGYDWYPPGRWTSTEQVDTRLRVGVPAHLPEGEYQLGVLLLDEYGGEVLRPLGAETATWDTGLRVRIVSPEAARVAAEADRERALERAAAGDCGAVWEAFKEATRHRLRDLAWRHETEPGVRRALAGCWIGRAAAAPDEAGRVDALVQARRWDHRHPDLDHTAVPLAETLAARGEALGAAGAWEDAYRSYTLALALDPSRAWTRRHAEEARDHVLGLVPAE